MRGLHRSLAPLLALAIVAVACSAPRASTGTPTASTAASASATPDFTGKSLNIVTGGTGGVYIVYGAGLADLLTKKLKVAASAQQTTASVDNMKFIGQGKADLAFVLADTAYDGIQGKAPQFDSKIDAKALAVLYYNYTHLVVKADSGINSVTDLKGKRVSMGSAGSGTEIIGNRTLEAYGLNPDADIQRSRLGVADSASQLSDGKIDAFFWSGGLPTAAVLDLANRVPLKFLDLTDSVKKMSDKYGPFYTLQKIPAGTYKNAADVPVSVVANLLVAPSKMDPALAKAILQTMFENQKDLVAVHTEASHLTLETATVGSPLEFHAGAIDFYKARGAWKQ